MIFAERDDINIFTAHGPARNAPLVPLFCAMRLGAPTSPPKRARVGGISGREFQRAKRATSHDAISLIYQPPRRASSIQLQLKARDIYGMS